MQTFPPCLQTYRRSFDRIEVPDAPGFHVDKKAKVRNEGHPVIFAYGYPPIGVFLVWLAIGHREELSLVLRVPSDIGIALPYFR